MASCLRSCAILCLIGVFDLAHGIPSIGIYTDLQGTQCAGSPTGGFLQGSVWAEVSEGMTGAEFGIYCSELWKGDIELIFFPEPAMTVLGDPIRCPLSPAELQIPNPPIADNGSVPDPPAGGGWHWRRCGKCICWCGDMDRRDDGLGGASMAFPSCQAGPRVRLLTFVLIERVPTSDVTLHIVERNPPTNPYFCCPLITLCDGVAFTKVCANDGESTTFPLVYYTPQSIINPSGAPRCKPLSAAPLALYPVSWSAVKGLYR